MHDRIKKLRTTLSLTQQEFADKIGVKRGAIANYEIGRNEPSDSVINLICLKLKVNETWLRTGEGEMFVSLDRDQEIAAFIGDVLSSEDDSFKKQLISVLSKLSADDWEALTHIADAIAEVRKKPDQ